MKEHKDLAKMSSIVKVKKKKNVIFFNIDILI